MVNAPYFGLPLPCGSPGCPIVLKIPAQHHAHSKRCLGKNLPALNTGIKCDKLNYRCGGVDFPNVERLKRHRYNVSRSKFDSDHMKQCFSPQCGCRLWLKSLGVHLARRRRIAEGADLRPSNEYKTRPKDQENRTKPKRHVSSVHKEDMGHINPVLDKNITSGKVGPDEEDGEDGDDWDVEEYVDDENDPDRRTMRILIQLAYHTDPSGPGENRPKILSSSRFWIISPSGKLVLQTQEIRCRPDWGQ